LAAAVPGFDIIRTARPRGAVPNSLSSARVSDSEN
jgi:hypothetical protein